MYKAQKAYLLKDRGHVVLDKSHVKNANEDEFEEITIVISLNQIKQWMEEIELLGLLEGDLLS